MKTEARNLKESSNEYMRGIWGEKKEEGEAL